MENQNYLICTVDQSDKIITSELLHAKNGITEKIIVDQFRQIYKDQVRRHGNKSGQKFQIRQNDRIVASMP